MDSRQQQTEPVKVVPKAWGYEKWIVNKPEYCGKLLFIREGKKGSYHYHKLKDETFYVHSGVLKVLYGFDDNFHGAKEVTLYHGDNWHVPPGMRHQLIATEDVFLYEFSTQHFDEDSYRVVLGDI